MSLKSRLAAPFVNLLWWLVVNYSEQGWMHIGRLDRMALMRVDQRSVEYFWVTRLLDRSDKRLLEIGCSGSWYSIFLTRLGYEVWGIDLIEEKRTAENFKFLLEDARVGDQLPDEFFDVVFSISVFEHIGLPEVNGETIVEDEDGDLKAAAAMARKVKPGGKFLITSPYGANPIHIVSKQGPFLRTELIRPYTRERVQRLIAASGLELVEADYFQYNQDDITRTLVLTDPDEMDRTGNYGSYGYGLVCLHLRKPTLR